MALLLSLASKGFNVTKTFFERGSGPLVSVLIPSRGRPESLIGAINSLYGLAEDKRLLEFCIKADEDDEETLSATGKLPAMFPKSRFFIDVSSRGNGYYDFHHWINGLASAAAGDWLFMFNDDARMLTMAWDQRLLFSGVHFPWTGIQDVCYFKVIVDGKGTDEFFFLRRKVSQILGHVACFPFVDQWISSIMRVIHPEIVAKVEVDHRAPEDSSSRSNTILANIMRNAEDIRRLKYLDIAALNCHLENLANLEPNEHKRA